MWLYKLDDSGPREDFGRATLAGYVGYLMVSKIIVILRILVHITM